MKRIRQKLSSSDVKTPTPTTIPAPALPSSTSTNANANTLPPLYARFATSSLTAQNTSSAEDARASRDRTSKILAVSSPMPLTKPADERRQPGRKPSSGVAEERERRLQKTQSREKEKERERQKEKDALLRGRSLDVRGDHDRREHGKTYPTPKPSHSPTRPTTTAPRSQSQHHPRREKDSGARKPLPSPSASPPITPRASHASLFSTPKAKEPSSTRHGNTSDAPPRRSESRAHSTSRPPHTSSHRSRRLPTPPSPNDQYASSQNQQFLGVPRSVHRTRSSQSLAPQSHSNAQSRSRSAVRSSSRAPSATSVQSPNRSQFAVHPQSPVHDSYSVLPRSPSHSQLRSPPPHSSAYTQAHVLPRSPSHSSFAAYPQTHHVLPRSPSYSHFPSSPSLQSHQVQMQPQPQQVEIQRQIHHPMASPSTPSQFPSPKSPEPRAQTRPSLEAYGKTPSAATTATTASKSSHSHSHSGSSSDKEKASRSSGDRDRSSRSSGDKDKSSLSSDNKERTPRSSSDKPRERKLSQSSSDKDKHNLRHKSRQVFHQSEPASSDLSPRPRPRATPGDMEGPRSKDAPNNDERTRTLSNIQPEGSADRSAEVTSSEKEQYASEHTEPVEVAAHPAPSVAGVRQTLYPLPDGLQYEPEPQRESEHKEPASMDAPYGPVRGKPLIFAAMTSSAELEQMATPPRSGHSNSYGYPSPPLEPISIPVEEHTPAFDTPRNPTKSNLPPPEPNPTPYRHSYGAEGDTSSSSLFSPHASLRKLFKRNSRDEEGRKHMGHQRSVSDGDTQGLSKHRPSKLQKRGEHSRKLSVTSTDAGKMSTEATAMITEIRPDAEMRPRTPTSRPPSPPPKTSSYGIHSAQQAQASVDRSASVVTNPVLAGQSAVSTSADRASEMNGTYNDPEQPEEEVVQEEHTQEDVPAEQEMPSILTTPRVAKPPTPPMSPDEYSRSRSRRRGHRLEAITAVVKDVKGKARAVPINPGLPYPLMQHLSNPDILPALLEYLSFWDWCRLSAVNKTVGKMFLKHRNLRECALERYLGSVGYSRWTWEEEEPLVLSIKDMHYYMQSVSMPTHQYHLMAQTYLASPKTHTDLIRNLAFCTRSYNRVVLRLRAQAEIMDRYSRRLSDPSRENSGHSSRMGTVGRSQSRIPSRAPSPNSFHGRNSTHQGASGTYSRAASQTRSQSRPSGGVIQASTSGSTMNSGQSVTFRSPLYRVRRAPLLYVFVPSPEGEWLSDTSVLECEAELKRAGVAHLLRAGDVVWDAAVGDEGNVGRMVWDGGYLLDLDYTFSMTGELPQYLHSLAFPPSYFHRVIRSVNNPMCYIDISPWSEEIADNLQLLQDRVKTETPQGTYHTVVRWVHRSSFVVKPPSIKMRIPNTDLFIDPGWFGTVVVEAEGTNEGLADLQDRCRDAFPPRAGSENKAPGRVFRILRERSRPGEVWIRTVREKERVM